MIYGNNTSAGNGAGVYMNSSSNNFVNCDVVCNTVNNNSYNGGGVYNSSSGNSMTNCIVWGNKKGYLSNNITSDGSYSNSGEILESCIISHNTASSNAGGVYAYHLRLNKCEVSYNVSNSGSGGGIYWAYHNNVNRDNITNCLVANNTASGAAGIYCNYGARIVNSTIVRNNNTSASNTAAGVYSYNECSILNSIIWGNRDNSGEANLSGSYNCQNSALEGSYSGTNIISLLPEPDGTMPLYPNFVNPSQTVGSNDATENVDWHLGNGSVCVNRGNNALLNVADSLDMDGNARIQMQTVDMGCYESPYEAITLPEYNGIVYVKENGTGDGTSWGNAMSSISNAIGVANMFDAVVWVAEGTYYGDSISASAFNIVEGVNVYGGFAGNEPANYDLSQRDFTAHASILDGQHNQRLLTQNNDFTTRTVWDGFTLQNGYAHQYGGVYNSNRNYGGGAYLRLGVILRNCVITGNSAESYGGGVYQTYNSYNTYDTTFLINCTVSHNTASQYGGGAYFNRYVVADGCSFEYNSNTYDGGGVYMSSNVLLDNCLVANNTTNNGRGAGIYTANSSASIRNSTIVNNEMTGSSNDKGAGIYAYYSTIQNCIVWGNKKDGEPSGIEGDNYVASYIASDASCTGTNKIALSMANEGYGALSPQFVNPSTTVGASDVTANVDWHLQQGSPCINRGDNSVAGTYDLDGNARVQMDVIDLGCYESPYQGVEMPNFNGIVYVKENGAGNMTGDSWDNAMPTIQSSLNVAAMNNAVVWVAAGTSNLVVMDVTPNSAKLVYALGTNATGFELQYGIEGSDSYETVQAQGGECLLTGLRFNTTYEARIRSLCDGNEQSGWKTVTFSTPLINIDHLYVTTTGTGDGSSWENASNDLVWTMNTAALIKETFGTQAVVWVAEGTYYGTPGNNAFTMVEGVDVYGGFAGTETELSQRDINNHPTILDGQNVQRVLNQPGSFSTQTTWDGFTLQHGNVTNLSGSYANCGGGAFLRPKGWHTRL